MALIFPLGARGDYDVAMGLPRDVNHRQVLELLACESEPRERQRRQQSPPSAPDHLIPPGLTTPRLNILAASGPRRNRGGPLEPQMNAAASPSAVPGGGAGTPTALRRSLPLAKPERPCVFVSVRVRPPARERTAASGLTGGRGKL